MKRKQDSAGSFRFVWGAPLVLGVLTVFGLLAALLGTGLWHWASWIALAAPVVVICKHVGRSLRKTQG